MYRLQHVPGHSQGHHILMKSTRQGLVPDRYVIVILCFICTLIMYVERVSFSIAYTAMAAKEGLEESKKGFILSCFFYGYAITQFPGGLLAQRYGGRRMLLVSYLCWALASLCMPSSALDHTRMALVRVAVGVAQGLIIPAIHSVVALWIPPHERARAVSFTTSGMYLGSTLTMVAVPSLVDLIGPVRVPRVIAFMGLAWMVLWALIGKEHPQVSVTLGPVGGKQDSFWVDWRKRFRTAFVLLQSSATWAICVNNFTFHYLIYVIMNWLPTYFTGLLGAKLTDLGMWAKAWPYMSIFIFSIVGGFAGDKLVDMHYTIGDARKLVNTAGFLSTALCCLGMARANSVSSGVFWTMVTMGAAGFARGGFSVNHMDIGPRHAGLLMGLSNTAGTIAGVIGVALTGTILDRNGGSGVREGWATSFAVCSVLAVAGNLVFWKYARGEKIFDDL